MKFISKLKFEFPTLPLAFHPRNCLECLKLIERFLFYITAREIKFCVRLYVNSVFTS